MGSLSKQEQDLHDAVRVPAKSSATSLQADRLPAGARKPWNGWEQTIALLAVLVPLLLGLFGWMWANMGRTESRIESRFERLEDRLDARLVQLDARLGCMEGHVADISRHVAHVEGHLGMVGNPPPKSKD